MCSIRLDWRDGILWNFHWGCVYLERFVSHKNCQSTWWSSVQHACIRKSKWTIGILNEMSFGFKKIPFVAKPNKNAVVFYDGTGVLNCGLLSGQKDMGMLSLLETHPPAHRRTKWKSFPPALPATHRLLSVSWVSAVPPWGAALISHPRHSPDTVGQGSWKSLHQDIVSEWLPHCPGKRPL